MKKNKLLKYVLIILALIVLATISFFWFSDKGNVFVENFEKFKSGEGYLERYIGWKPEISFKIRFKEFFDSGFISGLLTIFFSIFFNKTTIIFFMFFITFLIIKRVVIFRKVIFKNERSRKINEFIMFLPKIILKLMYFIYDLVFIYPIKYIIIYFHKKDRFGDRLIFKHLKYIFIAYVLSTGLILNILIDIIKFLKSYLMMMTLNFSEITSFASSLMYSVYRLLYFISDKLTIFRVFILVLVIYGLIAVFSAKVWKKKAIKILDKVIDKILGIIAAVTGFVGGGKTKTIAKIARRKEQKNWQVMRDEKNRIEIQYPDIEWNKIMHAFSKNFSKGYINTPKRARKNIMNSVVSIHGKDVLKRVYNEFKPEPRHFSEDIRLYADASFKLLQTTLIKSNLPVRGTGPTPELIRQIKNYGQTVGNYVDLNKPIFSKDLHFDNLRSPDKSISGEVVRDISAGEVIVITEADKPFSTFNQKTVLKSGFDKILAVIRHRLSFSYLPIGILLLDYQTDTSFIRQARTKADNILKISESKKNSSFLLRPVIKFVSFRKNRLEKNKKYILENRMDDNLYLKRINESLGRLLIIENWLKQFNYARISYNIETPDGDLIGKIKITIYDDVHSYYDSVVFAKNERELEDLNTNIPKSFTGLQMTKEQMKRMYSEHYDEQYLSDDPEVRGRDYKYLNKESVDNSEYLDKLEYYLNRVDDDNLSEGQRKYARNWLDKNGGEEWE